MVGFILGFAMQDSLSNLAAGMMILINRPYDVGDLVEIAGVFGKVEQMFFPNSTRAQFFVEFYFPEGTHIRETEARVAKVEKYLQSRDEVTDLGQTMKAMSATPVTPYVSKPSAVERRGSAMTPALFMSTVKCNSGSLSTSCWT